jgi:hypothetical protein
LARLVEIVAYVLTAAIFLRAVLFWVGLDPSNRVVAFLHDITKVRHGGELGEPSRGAPAGEPVGSLPWEATGPKVERH